MHEILEISALLSPTLLAAIQSSQKNGLWVLGSLELVILIWIGVNSLRFSKRVGGPVISLLKHLDKVQADKSWSKFSLRKGDLFEELPDKINAAFEVAHPTSK